MFQSIWSVMVKTLKAPLKLIDPIKEKKNILKIFEIEKVEAFVQITK